jgi:serine-type anaerobic sulfatase-maturating enzyme
MNFSVMAKTIASALSDPENDPVEFIWHGGEPTVLPFSFYEKVLYVQSIFRRPGQTVSNLIQTNGTRITKHWAQFLRDNQFYVGISLDGPPEIHDKNRKYASGKPSFCDVLSSISTLRKYGIPISVLMVINDDGLKLGAKSIFDFFLKIGIKSYGLLPVTPVNLPNAPAGTTTSGYVDPPTMCRFLIELYDIWRKHGDHTIRIREIETIVQSLKGNTPSYCTLAGGCIGNYFMVEPNGTITHCDLFEGDSHYTLGNILEQDLASMRKGSQLEILDKANRNELQKMKTCSEFSICNGWCPHERYLSLRHNVLHNSSCCGLRELIQHIRNNMPMMN